MGSIAEKMGVGSAVENNASQGTSDHVFKDLDADDLNRFFLVYFPLCKCFPLRPVLLTELSLSEPTIVESLCMSCGENGVTRLLLTKIPHYKEIILMSFHCEHCGFKNNEIQSGGVIQEKGVRITVTLANERDLSRQVLALLI